ncbi:MAG TPA: DUF3781 domain-containing protein [Firmicutes bacterium]|nr:DUF3781 domain-containing protein [Bacillota bacterium]
MEWKKFLLDNIDRLRVTEKGRDRVGKNLRDGTDVLEYCKQKIADVNSVVYRQGKNLYCETDGLTITVNASSFTIITARVSGAGCSPKRFGAAEKEKTVRRWFGMWTEGRRDDLRGIFSDDVVYTESWGPRYEGLDRVRLWFDEWNTRGRVDVWDIKWFMHGGERTVVRWYFENTMGGGAQEKFDGVSVVVWKDCKILCLTEFGCSADNYDPYENGGEPVFRHAEHLWF